MAVKNACTEVKRMSTKIRAQVNLSEEVVLQIDAVVGPRKRSEFLERAAVAQLRREALDRWMKLGEKFKGLTLEDVYYPSRRELEERGG
jgi:metal-responsive CopG/Arc/MetJ family transcriptional regulator